MSPQHCHARTKAAPLEGLQRRLYDKGYDADALLDWLKQRAIAGDDGEPTRPS